MDNAQVSVTCKVHAKCNKGEKETTAPSSSIDRACLALRKVNVPTVLMDGTRMFEVKLNASNVNLAKILLVQNNFVQRVIQERLVLSKVRFFFLDYTYAFRSFSYNISYIFFIGNCTDCPNGWYSDVRGQTECKQCKLGEDFVGPKQSCSACDIGTFGAVEGEHQR